MKAIKENITGLEIDTIVNAANASLQGGGGVDGAIHRAGGTSILEECEAWVKENGELPTGQAMITTAGNLPCKKVIHTVGPIWHKEEAQKQELADCYTNSLKLARENGLKSIAFSNISTGVYGFPKDLAADIAIETCRQWLAKGKSIAITFCCFDDENFQLYQERLANQGQ